MSSPDTDARRTRWRPWLHHSRDAINPVPSIAQHADAASMNSTGTVLPPGQETVELPGSQFAYLPIDGIVKSIQRSKSFVLGVGSIGRCDLRLVRSINAEIVTRCSRKIDRKAILVTVGESNPAVDGVNVENRDFEHVFWTTCGGSKAELKAWHAQLGTLPRWKQEFGLIVLDLGDASSPQMPKIGRLCSGVVLQLFNSISSRETIRALKSVQKENLPVLGAWSMDLDSRKSAA